MNDSKQQGFQSTLSSRRTSSELNVVKMIKLNDHLSKFFCFIIFLITVKCAITDAKPNERQSDYYLNFDRIKNDIFLNNHLSLLNKSIENSYQNGADLVQCINELNSIKTGLINSEQWTLRSNTVCLNCVKVYFNSMIHDCFFILVVDAWGKLSSGILNGNLYDLGAFSQCLHIENSNSGMYKMQYCLAHVIFNLQDFI